MMMMMTIAITTHYAYIGPILYFGLVVPSTAAGSCSTVSWLYSFLFYELAIIVVVFVVVRRHPSRHHHQYQ